MHPISTSPQENLITAARLLNNKRSGGWLVGWLVVVVVEVLEVEDIEEVEIEAEGKGKSRKEECRSDLLLEKEANHGPQQAEKQ